LKHLAQATELVRLDLSQTSSEASPQTIGL